MQPREGHRVDHDGTEQHGTDRTPERSVPPAPREPAGQRGRQHEPPQVAAGGGGESQDIEAGGMDAVHGCQHRKPDHRPHEIQQDRRGAETGTVRGADQQHPERLARDGDRGERQRERDLGQARDQEAPRDRTRDLERDAGGHAGAWWRERQGDGRHVVSASLRWHSVQAGREPTGYPSPRARDRSASEVARRHQEPPRSGTRPVGARGPHARHARGRDGRHAGPLRVGDMGGLARRDGAGDRALPRGLRRHRGCPATVECDPPGGGGGRREDGGVARDPAA